MMAHFEVWGLQAMECRGRSRQFISVTNFVSAEEQTILMFPRPAPIPGRASHQVDLEFLLSAFFLLLLLAILFVPRKKKQQKQQKQAKKRSLSLSPGVYIRALFHCLLTFSDRQKRCTCCLNLWAWTLQKNGICL